MGYRHGDSIHFGERRKIDGVYFNLYQDNLENKEEIQTFKNFAKEEGYKKIRTLKSSSYDIWAVYVLGDV